MAVKAMLKELGNKKRQKKKEKIVKLPRGDMIFN